MNDVKQMEMVKIPRSRKNPIYKKIKILTGEFEEGVFAGIYWNKEYKGWLVKVFKNEEDDLCCILPPWSAYILIEGRFTNVDELLYPTIEKAFSQLMKHLETNFKEVEVKNEIDE